jgi:hypothetical protein
VAEVILFVCLGYGLCGLAVGVPFVLRGVNRMDASAQRAGIGFRLLILPGTIALWPLMVAKWLRAERQS